MSKFYQIIFSTINFLRIFKNQLYKLKHKIIRCFFHFSGQFTNFVFFSPSLSVCLERLISYCCCCSKKNEKKTPNSFVSFVSRSRSSGYKLINWQPEKKKCSARSKKKIANCLLVLGI